MQDQNANPNEFVISRTFNAPRKTIFKAFTEEKHLAHWWGPAGFKLLVSKLDLRAGGTFHYKMSSPEGHEMWGIFKYIEIVAPEKIVFINAFSNEKGELTRHPMAPNWPLEVKNTMTLTEMNGKTTLTLRGGPINATEDEMNMFRMGFSSMEQGFGGTFNQLDEYLKNYKD